MFFFKDRLVHINKDQGFNLQRNLNRAVSAYQIEPQCATGFSHFVLLYICEAVTPYEVLFTRYTSEEQNQGALALTLKRCLKQQSGFLQ